MATQRKARRGRAVRAWVLIRFHQPVARSVERLRRVEVASGWPGRASVMRVDRVRPIRTSGDAKRRYHAFVEVHAANRAALDRVADYIEENFSHTDVYEF